MPLNYEDIRYSGDAQDVKELQEAYRIDHYLQTYEEQRKGENSGYRERLMKDGIKLTDQLSPRIYNIYNDVCVKLQLEVEKEIFCLPGTDINAFAIFDIRESGNLSLVGITVGALEELDDNEIKFILGHELGHFIFEHNRMNALYSNNDNGPLTVLASLGESLFLRWKKKSEISADRMGLLACGEFIAAAKALLKGTFGLSEKNLNLDIDALLQQIEHIKGHQTLVAEAFSSHPLLPIRLKALELFSRSEKAIRNGYPHDGQVMNDDMLESSVDEMVKLTSRFPHTKLLRAMMRATSLAGALMLSIDGDVGDEEVKILIEMLHYYFTDEPEKEIVTDLAILEKELPTIIEEINESGNYDAKIFIVSRLADIALADGSLSGPESGVILQVAKLLKLPEKVGYNVMIGAAQSIGFRHDAKLNRIAKDLRNKFQNRFQK